MGATVEVSLAVCMVYKDVSSVGLAAWVSYGETGLRFEDQPWYLLHVVCSLHPALVASLLYIRIPSSLLGIVVSRCVESGHPFLCCSALGSVNASKRFQVLLLCYIASPNSCPQVSLLLSPASLDWEVCCSMQTTAACSTGVVDGALFAFVQYLASAACRHGHGMYVSGQGN